MSGPVKALPVIPVCSIIYGDCESRENAVCRLEDYFGDVEDRSGDFPFDLSDYYGDEMGIDLSRIWLSFARLADASMLAGWKLHCYDIEKRYLKGSGGRSVNIDPGYMDYGKLVLASFKEAPDKVYMGEGVWAHVCLRYGYGHFSAPDHSFPDFKDGRFDDFMLEVRRSYRRILRSAGD